MKAANVAAAVFVVLGIGFIWALVQYKRQADTAKATMDAGADASSEIGPTVR